MMRSISVVLACVLVLAGAEWAAREAGFGEPPLAKAHPQIGYYLVPGRSYVRFGNSVRVNRYGFRSDDFDVAALPASDHIVLIGDSVVYGNHHLDQSQTVAARMQQRLREQARNDRVVVSSIAASSWSPANQLAFYQRFGPFPARQAWIVLSTHDLVDPVNRHLDAIPYRTSSPFGALHDLTLALFERAETAARQRLPGTGSSREVISTEPKLRELIVLLKRQGVDVRLCLHLTVSELALAADPPALAPLARLATDLQVPLVVTKAAYRQAQSQGHSVHHDDIHLSASGAQTLAELLLAKGAREERAR